MSVGFFDAITGGRASGWAYVGDGDAAVVEILDGATVIGEAVANIYREDLKHAGYGNGFHGWTFDLPEDIWRDCPPLEARVKGAQTLLSNNTMEGVKRQNENFLNSFYKGLPNTECVFTSRSANENDEEIASEIIDIYRKSQDYQSEPNSIWDLHFKTAQSKFRSLLDSGDIPKVARYLCDLPTAEASHGFLQGQQASKDFFTASPQELSAAEALTKDVMISFAQYLAIVNLECAELGPLGESLLLDQREVGRQIEREIGFALPTPLVFNGLLGIALDSGSLNRRSIHAIYLAHRAFSTVGGSGYNICEIGGGAGMAAYYSMMFGAMSYTLVDLPIMTLFQYYFVRSALPARRVTYVLSDSEEMEQQHGINIIPANIYRGLNKSWTWDLIVNSDSFPEMGDRICEDYFQSFKRRAPRLFSINQETNGPLTSDIHGPKQTVVSDILKKRNDYQRVLRYKSWISHGYAEELYNIDPYK